MNSKENSMALNLCIHFFTTNHYMVLIKRIPVLVSLHTALFKSHNYGHYM